MTSSKSGIRNKSDLNIGFSYSYKSSSLFKIETLDDWKNNQYHNPMLLKSWKKEVCQENREKKIIAINNFSILKFGGNNWKKNY